MASRPRSKARKNWPANLYARDRNGPYYFWRHPGTGKEHGLGRDFVSASTQAIEANLHIGGITAERRLVDRLKDDGQVTVAEFLPTFRSVKVAKGLAPNTVKALDSNLRKIEAGIGSMILRRVTTQDLNDRITEPLMLADKDRAAGQVRSVLNELFLTAAGKGKVDSNPVASLMVNEAKVKRDRLSIDQFKSTYEAALTLPDRWIANMLRLAIVSAQPRECLCGWERSDVRAGFLWNERGKTGARIKLPIGLKVPELGWVLSDAIKACQDDIISRTLLHHNRSTAYGKIGDPVFIDTLTKGFARARDLADVRPRSGMKPPSLHEVRSLALRLYRDAYGSDFAQNLAGHKDVSTTNVYTDVRGSEWIEVRIA